MIPPLQRTFTLIELLAVVALSAMALSIAGVHLAAGADEARFSAAVARLRDLDAQARLGTTPHSATRIEVSRNATEGSTRIVLTTAGEQLALVELAPDVVVSFRTDGQEGNAVEFEARGRSEDYVVEVGLHDRRVQWHVCGLTGWIIEGEAEAPP